LLWVKLTNKGVQSISINESTYVMIYQPYSESGEEENYFYIVDNRSTSGNVLPYGTPQIVPPNMTDPSTGVTQILKFGAVTKGGTTLKTYPIVREDVDSDRKYLFAGFVGLFYRWTGISQNYGIQLPLWTQKTYPFAIAATPTWSGSVQRPTSGTTYVYHVYTLRAYAYTNWPSFSPVYPTRAPWLPYTVTVRVNRISGPGTITYATGPWSHTLNNGNLITSPQRSISITSSTVPGTYVFEVSFTYTISWQNPSYSETLTRRFTLVVT